MITLNETTSHLKCKVDSYIELLEKFYYTKLLQSNFIHDSYLLSSNEKKEVITQELKQLIEHVFYKNLPVKFQLAPHPDQSFLYLVYCNTIKIFESDFFNKTYRFLLAETSFDERIQQKQMENEQLTNEIKEILIKTNIDTKDLDNVKNLSEISLAIPIFGKKKRNELIDAATQKRELCNRNRTIISEIKKEKMELNALRESIQEDIETCILFFHFCHLTENKEKEHCNG